MTTVDTLARWTRHPTDYHRASSTLLPCAHRDDDDGDERRWIVLMKLAEMEEQSPVKRDEQ